MVYRSKHLIEQNNTCPKFKLNVHKNCFSIQYSSFHLKLVYTKECMYISLDEINIR